MHTSMCSMILNVMNHCKASIIPLVYLKMMLILRLASLAAKDGLSLNKVAGSKLEDRFCHGGAYLILVTTGWKCYTA